LELGVDIKALLYGAGDIYTDFFERGDILKTLVEKAISILIIDDEIPIILYFGLIQIRFRGFLKSAYIQSGQEKFGNKI